MGGGGREHALCWALKRDTPDAEVLAAPGNPGTAQLGINLAIPVTATADLVGAVREHRIDFTIVGPEGPLAFLYAADDILDHDDRIVDDEARPDRQSHQ